MYSENLAIILLVAANGFSHPGYIHPHGAQAERPAGAPPGAAIAKGGAGQAARLPRYSRIPAKKAPAGTPVTQGKTGE